MFISFRNRKTWLCYFFLKKKKTVVLHYKKYFFLEICPFDQYRVTNLGLILMTVWCITTTSNRSITPNNSDVYF